MRRFRQACPKLAADDRGSSAIEFSIVLPVLILLMLAGIQVVLYINAVRRVEMIATSISEMLAQATPPTSSATAKVSQLDLHFAYDSSMVIFPYLMKDAAQKNMSWWQDISINFAGIQFSKNGSSCGTNPDQSACYVASVGWTSVGTAGSRYRPCLVPQIPADDAAAPTRWTLPRSLYGDGSVIAVDVSFNFTPTFGASLLPQITINRSVFVQPRYATYITYDTTDSDGIATLCPGFS